jgi:membrane-bound lytic murein transglycosylase MltF
MRFQDRPKVATNGPDRAAQAFRRGPRTIPAAFTLCAALLAGLVASAAPAAAISSGEALRVETTRVFTGDYNEMVARRRIRVLIPLSRTFFHYDRGEIRGLAVDMLRAFERQVNAGIRDRSKRVVIYYLPTPRDKLFTELLAGRGDIVIANLTITPDRERKVDFSTPFMTGVAEVVVTTAASPAVTKPDDLSGRSVMVRRQSSYFESLTRLNADLASRNLPPVTIHEADPGLEDEDLLEMVQAGTIPATVIDRHKAEMWKKVWPTLITHDAAPLRTDGEVAWAFRPGSPQLAEAVNRFMAGSRAGTERGNIAIRTYYRSDRWLDQANSQTNIEFINRLRGPLEKYAARYDIDPFILAAVAFQESRFDHRTRSRAGAVGIMQMMPATARDPNVALPDVTDFDTNIHGFARYFRFLRNRYVNQPDMTDYDRLMLLLASYNAGPNRIRRLRARATDPNVWDESVEWAVWRDVGFETVQYVRNVHRYYIVFRDFSRGLELRRTARSGLERGKE